MALLALLPEHSLPNNNNGKNKINNKQKQKHKQNQKQKQKEKQGSSSSSSSSWEQIKNLISCKQVEGSRVHDPSSSKSMMGSSCSSICSFRDVVHGNTRVVHRADNSSPESSSLGQQETGLLSRKPAAKSSRRSSGKSNGGATYTPSSSKGMQFRKLSGCYECHMIIDPSRLPIPRSSVCACSECGEVFPKMESLELHQAVRHAVWELGPEDSGRNIVEIIFKSSWLKKDNSICKIERILKVQNSQRTIQRFEECRDSVKSRAQNSSKKNPRCAADGNELLRFHCTTLTCPLGAQGSTALCTAIPGCGVCTVIRHGFQGGGKGVKTTASSGRAHDSLAGHCGAPRAMLVCRVIAGRVRRVPEDAPPEDDGVSASGGYDSIAGSAGIYSNLEELVVFNPRAILPCFVVVYKVLSC